MHVLHIRRTGCGTSFLRYGFESEKGHQATGILLFRALTCFVTLTEKKDPLLCSRQHRDFSELKISQLLGNAHRELRVGIQLSPSNIRSHQQRGPPECLYHHFLAPKKGEKNKKKKPNSLRIIWIFIVWAYESLLLCSKKCSVSYKEMTQI